MILMIHKYLSSCCYVYEVLSTMIDIIKPRHKVSETTYEICFYKDEEICWGFPADENGNLIKDANYENWKPNYDKAMADPTYTHRLEKQINTWTENAQAKCHCGETIELYNEYMGACECPSCGQWYNVFGQELKNPSEWEMAEDY